jgi:hypothetical protein
MKLFRETPQKHGDPMECPSCGNPECFLDLDTPSGEAVQENACWYNTQLEFKGWECTDCWLK